MSNAKIAAGASDASADAKSADDDDEQIEAGSAPRQKN